MVNKRATKKNTHSKNSKVSGKKSQKKFVLSGGANPPNGRRHNRNRNRNRNRSNPGNPNQRRSNPNPRRGNQERGGRESGGDRFHGRNTRRNNDRHGRDGGDGGHGRGGRGGQGNSSQRSNSKGKTIEKYLKKIEKRIHKAFCRTRRNCAAYPHEKTLKIIEDFYKDIKSVNDDIKRANGDDSRCEGVERDMDKLDIC